MLHRTPTTVLSRSIESHGHRMVKHAASQIAIHLKPENLDIIAPILLPKLSDGFLDKALALRLESIQAQQLVNALGRAERLGYDVRDVVSGNPMAPSRHERVIPAANPIPKPPANMLPQASQAAPVYQQTDAVTRQVLDHEVIVRTGIVFCERCNRPCGGPRALLTVRNSFHFIVFPVFSFVYLDVSLMKVLILRIANTWRQHGKSRRCGLLPPPVDKLGKEHCIFCGQYFVGGAGLRYHVANAVCGQYGEEVRSALMVLFEDADEQHRKTMAHGRDSQASQGASPGPSGSPVLSPKDPYSVLTPETRRRMEDELAKADEHFNAQMKALSGLEESVRKAETLRLKNSYNTKQSTIRKKYGIKLRERRTRAEIEEERSRIKGTSSRSTPGQTPTGKRAHSEVDDTPVSVSTGRGSPSRHGTPPKRMLITEVNGSARSRSVGTAEPKDAASTSTSPISVPHSTPGSAIPAATAPSSSATRPMPMSIAGSYTNPVRAPDVAKNDKKSSASGAATPIEITDGEGESDSHTDADMDDVDDVDNSAGKSN